jgi:hypothetical protein
MLRGLPGIQHKSVKLACTILRNISTPGMHSKVLHSRHALQGPSIFGMDQPTSSSGSAPHHVLHVVHLAYLDEMQDASV